jgi:thioesterase domain-containing protein/acyl carrier protein
VAGAAVSWDALYGGQPPRRISLPTYPFARDRHWALDGSSSAPSLPASPGLAAPAAGADTIATLRALLAEELGESVEDIDPAVELIEYGVDSIHGSVITGRLQQMYGDFIPQAALITYPSLGELAEFIDETTGGAAAGPIVRERRAPRIPPELVPFNRRGDHIPSYWVHGGPGYAAIYSNLTKRLGRDYPFYSFQAKGSDGSGPPQTFEEMVEHYVTCIQAAHTGGPFVLGGYSYGGLVAYEIARRLSDAGMAPKHLVIFDTLPSCDEAFEKFAGFFGQDDHFLTLMMVNELAGARDAGGPLVTLDDLVAVPDKLRVAHAAKLAVERGDSPMSSNEIYRRTIAAIALGDVTEEVYVNWRPGPYDGSPVLYLKAREFLAADNWIGAAGRDVFRDYDYIEPWRQLCTAGFASVDVPSDHFEMLNGGALEVCSAAIRQVIDGAPVARDNGRITEAVVRYAADSRGATT